MASSKTLLIAATLLAASQLAACTITPPNSKYASRQRCEHEIGSLVCSNGEANPESGGGLSAPGVLNNIQAGNGLNGGGH